MSSFFFAIAESVTSMIQEMGGLGVFFGVILESIIAPIPSPLIIMGAGFFLIPAGAGFDQLISILIFEIAIPGALGSTLGAFIGYTIGFAGGKPLIEKFASFLGVSWREIELAQKKFKERGQEEITLFALRALPVVPLSVISVGAGLLRIETRLFTIWTFLGSLVRCIILGILGYLGGEIYATLAEQFDSIETAVTLLIVLAVIGAFVYLRARERVMK